MCHKNTARTHPEYLQHALHGEVEAGQRKPTNTHRKQWPGSTLPLPWLLSKWATWANHSLQMSLAFWTSHHFRDSHRLIVTIIDSIAHDAVPETGSMMARKHCIPSNYSEAQRHSSHSCSWQAQSAEFQCLGYLQLLNWKFLQHARTHATTLRPRKINKNISWLQWRNKLSKFGPKVLAWVLLWCFSWSGLWDLCVFNALAVKPAKKYLNGRCL
jgi:hypothetical protein